MCGFYACICLVGSRSNKSTLSYWGQFMSDFMFCVILSGVEVVKVAGFMKVQRPVSCLVYVCIWLFDK